MAEQLTPPGEASRFCGLHWLQQVWFGSAGVPPYVALQWNPGSKTWTHSNQHDVYGAQVFSVTVENYRYVRAITLPELGE